MDVSHQFFKIGIFLTYNGFIPVLKYMAIAIVSGYVKMSQNRRFKNVFGFCE